MRLQLPMQALPEVTLSLLGTTADKDAAAEVEVWSIRAVGSPRAAQRSILPPTPCTHEPVPEPGRLWGIACWKQPMPALGILPVAGPCCRSLAGTGPLASPPHLLPQMLQVSRRGTHAPLPGQLKSQAARSARSLRGCCNA
jgi:hypothetical protein